MKKPGTGCELPANEPNQRLGQPSKHWWRKEEEGGGQTQVERERDSEVREKPSEKGTSSEA